MKTHFASLAAGLGLAALAGCATTPPASVAQAPQAVPAAQLDSSKFVYGDDTALIHAIDNVAFQRGVQVVWLSYPQKRIAPPTIDNP